MKKISLTQNINKRRGIIKPQKSDIVVTLDYQASNSWMIATDVIKSTCINCNERPCVNLSQVEVSLEGEFKKMPHSETLNTCPVNAIQISESTGFPNINLNKCIFCNICVSRCPTGAINTNILDLCFIADSGNQAVEMTDNFDVDQNLSAIKEKRIIPSFLSEATIIKHHTKVFDSLALDRNVENILVRNLLISLGIKCQTRAIGNNDIRIDLLGQEENLFLVCEIDLGTNDLLDLPRAILDDIAIVHSRYSIPLKNIVPLMILKSFPNKRSDFYETLSDIYNITGIRVSTVSFHFLYMLNLLGKKISLKELHGNFCANHYNLGILDEAIKHFPELREFDGALQTDYYSAIK